MYYILRNGQQFGPYDIQALAHYVSQGNVLMHDRITDAGGTLQNMIVKDVLQAAGIKPKIASNGSVFNQLGKIGWDLLFPRKSISYKNLKSDKRLLLISIIGLTPAFLIRFTGSSYFTFYAIALYFSLIWALFFYYVFKTPQVRNKTTVGVFFATQVVIFILIDLVKFDRINPLYALVDAPSIFLRFIGYFLGVGVTEEAVKALVLYWLSRRAREPQVPQTMVFYGLISGLGFGVFEGVVYQLTVNRQLGYKDSFFMNIARLTSLPFLHAIWAGIAGYFVAMGYLFPRNRKSLWLLSIGIPALLHGLYDTLGWSIPGLIVSYASVGLLVIYLQRAHDFQNRMVP